MEPHHIKSPGIESARAGPADSPHQVVHPYKGGPSALDKAMSLFLFTELVRGKYIAGYCPKGR
jgi:NADH dehydrogenase (ubiquinone) Fe-S protein 8